METYKVHLRFRRVSRKRFVKLIENRFDRFMYEGGKPDLLTIFTEESKEEILSFFKNLNAEISLHERDELTIYIEGTPRVIYGGRTI